MRKTVIRSLRSQGVELVGDRYITKKDYDMIARMRDFIKVRTVQDAKEVQKEIREHIEEIMALIKSLKDAIPEHGSGTAYHLAMKMLKDTRTLDEHYDDLFRNKFFKRSDREPLAKPK